MKRRTNNSERTQEKNCESNHTKVFTPKLCVPGSDPIHIKEFELQEPYGHEVRRGLRAIDQSRNRRVFKNELTLESHPIRVRTCSLNLTDLLNKIINIQTVKSLRGYRMVIKRSHVAG